MARGTEFVRQLKAFARERGIEVRVESSRGKGSHQTLWYGDRKSIVPDLKKEWKEGTRRSVLKALGFNSGRLEDD